MANEVYSTRHGADVSALDEPEIRRIGLSDLTHALVKGWEDFSAKPSHAVFLVLIYPVVGLILLRVTAGEEVFPLLFPLMSGFALVGPFAAVGIYEISRRREAGLDAHWSKAVDVVEHRSFGSILTLGLALVGVFITWLVVAWVIYDSTMGSARFVSSGQFLEDLFTTREGWTMIVLGNLAGLGFAMFAFAISVVSFPYILDRHATAGQAIRTSVRAVAANPGTMALWGLMIAVALVLGTLPFFIGLAVVLPVLAHASWHVYRRVVA